MPRTVDVNQFRRGNLKIGDLEALSAMIGEGKQRLDAYIAKARRLRIPSINVDGVKKIPNGMKMVEAGVTSIAKGIAAAGGLDE